MPLNDWFEGRYSIEREAVEARLARGDDPLILRVGDQLVLLHEGRRLSEVVMTESYLRAMAVCHVPAAVYLLVGRHEPGQILPARTLANARTLSAELSRELEGADTDEQAMLDLCRTVLDAVVAWGRAGERDLKRLSEQTEAPMRALVDRATRAYLSRLDETMAKWTRGWDDSTWDRLLVVVCAGHAPRYKESTRTYFERLLGERQGRGAEDEHQVLYAEGAQDERQAMALAASHLINRELGRFFMGSTVALQEDVLGDAAERVLDRTFGCPAGHGTRGEEGTRGEVNTRGKEDTRGEDDGRNSGTPHDHGRDNGSAYCNPQDAERTHDAASKAERRL